MPDESASIYKPWTQGYLLFVVVVLLLKTYFVFKVYFFSLQTLHCLVWVFFLAEGLAFGNELMFLSILQYPCVCWLKPYHRKITIDGSVNLGSIREDMYTSM